MAVRVRSIQTAVPRVALEQHRVRDLFAAQPDLTRLGRRLVGAAFDASGIERRHTVVTDLDRSTPGAPDAPRAFVDDSGVFLSPTTRERNELYIAEAGGLAVSAARRALAAAPDIPPAAVTHVVTVSCTGFSAPGVDQQLVRALGLHPTVERYHIGFMGCYAAFPALRLARSLCEGRPDAVVLVVAVELCTLHVRSSNDSDQIVASSVFADGAAAALVTAAPAPLSAPALVLDDFASEIAPVGSEEMAWTIGDHGFDMVLSAAVPRIIDDYVEGAIAPLLLRAGLGAGLGEAAAEIAQWAVHPGGRSILDRVQATLALSDAQLGPSREVLREFGNMSSATVLFVLARILESAGARPLPAEGERVCAMAFGPGLTIESALLTLVPVVVPSASRAVAAVR
ncbi:type III polyketide synthase [Herbiconiux moechotypicola]|uniref:Type III polyketide synthase n=1 Tax=Herbiconiux moechotypicola TaxID=637393 RepID=A0ABP5Q4K8_9MICO|nr:type III polyketide synthase [Herbiconiux moechotypicola]MCS5728481.1 type III polyketide synthase [Herbiconiux moechotypicola]